jgi:predicted nucleic acid-binding protein
VLLDTGVVIRALGQKTDQDAALCRELWTTAREHRKVILIGVHTIAEMLRGRMPASLPRVSGVAVVPFDGPAAVVLGRQFSFRFIGGHANQHDVPRPYVKYDAMIVACAIRHRADMIVSLDGGVLTLARSAKLSGRRPVELQARQVQ